MIKRTESANHPEQRQNLDPASPLLSPDESLLYRSFRFCRTDLKDFILHFLPPILPSNQTDSFISLAYKLLNDHFDPINFNACISQDEKHHFYNLLSQTRVNYDVFPCFKLNEPLEPQLDRYAAKTVLTQKHLVYEGNDGSLIIGYRTFFELGERCRSFINQYDCYINQYQQLLWFEPDNGGNDEYTEQEALRTSIAKTGDKAVIVPTIRIKEDGTNECFLDFLANWRQSKRGDRITSKIGKFIITHELTRNNELITQTSLRISDSIWMSSECY